MYVCVNGAIGCGFQIKEIKINHKIAYDRTFPKLPFL
jgi:hypothetical protein